MFRFRHFWQFLIHRKNNKERLAQIRQKLKNLGKKKEGSKDGEEEGLEGGEEVEEEEEEENEIAEVGMVKNILSVVGTLGWGLIP